MTTLSVGLLPISAQVDSAANVYMVISVAINLKRQKSLGALMTTLSVALLPSFSPDR